jgi:glucose-1-phosphate thymidylyltransferase
MQNDIKNILIIVNKGQVDQFKKILPIKNNLGIKIQYKEQIKPAGLPDAFLIGKNFIKNDNVVLILGDNFFYSRNIRKTYFKNIKFKNGANILLCPVKKPQLYGVAKINKKNKVLEMIEKPKNPKSNLAITGLYIFDKNVVNYSKLLKPSKRNELEIIDLLKIYQKKGELTANKINKDVNWLDAGSVKDLSLASQLVKNVEKIKGKKIGCLEEIALKNKWINKQKIIKSIKFYGNCDYSRYLKSLI